MTNPTTKPLFSTGMALISADLSAKFIDSCQVGHISAGPSPAGFM